MEGPTLRQIGFITEDLTPAHRDCNTTAIDTTSGGGKNFFQLLLPALGAITLQPERPMRRPRELVQNISSASGGAFCEQGALNQMGQDI